MINMVNIDCTGREIEVGDTIVYFVKSSCVLRSQKAKVEFIGSAWAASSGHPHIRVLREDAVERDRFTRKTWLWSFANSVLVEKGVK